MLVVERRSMSGKAGVVYWNRAVFRRIPQVQKRLVFCECACVFVCRWKAEVKNGDKFFILMTGTNMENFPVSKDDSVNIARFETTVKKGGISC